MTGIRHSVVTAKPNNPAKDVSADAWNAEHVIDDESVPTVEVFAGLNQRSFAGYYDLKAVHPSAGASYSACCQSFISPSTVHTLVAARFYLKKTLAPTGVLRAKLYAHSGVFGTSSVPTGSPLAVSDDFDLSTLETAVTEFVTFTFTGANQYSLAASTSYVITLEVASGVLDAANYVSIGGCNAACDGNLASFSNSAWTAAASEDLVFYVYGLITLDIPQCGASKTLLLAPATTMSLTGLNLVQGRKYKLAVSTQFTKGLNGGAGVSTVWKINGDATTTNYSVTAIMLYHNSGAIGKIQQDSNLFNDNANEPTTSLQVAELQITPEGNVILARIDTGYRGTANEIAIASLLYEPLIPITRITQIDIVVSVAGGLGAGSFIEISYVP